MCGGRRRRLGSIWLGSLFTRNDVDNDGTRESDLGNAVQFSAGGRLQFANLGVGLTAMNQTYQVTGQGGLRSDISFTTWRAGGAYALLRGNLVVGAALRVVNFARWTRATMTSTARRATSIGASRSGSGTRVCDRAQSEAMEEASRSWPA